MASVTAIEPDGLVELISMWVAPFARGRGVGDALVTAALDWARERKASGVALAVLEGNERALALYRRHGFVDAGEMAGSGGCAIERKLIRHLI
jgi:ribosomal protein S18 acetylase RimI-like enzyme